MKVLIAAILLALTLAQDPAADELRTLLRRMETPSENPAEDVEILLQLQRAVEQAAPRNARSMLGDALRGERLPAARRLDVAESLLGLDDRETWSTEAGRIALDDAEPPETRVRAALLFSRAGARGAADLGRRLAERLFAEDTDASARAIGTHLRGGVDADQQRREIDYLFRLHAPAALAALRDALADDAVDPALRLEIAERLHATDRLDRVRDAIAALERIRLTPTLAGRAEALIAALRGIREEPRGTLAAEPAPAAPAEPVDPASTGMTPGKVNLILAGATLVVLAALFGFRRR